MMKMQEKKKQLKFYKKSHQKKKVENQLYVKPKYNKIYNLLVIFSKQKRELKI